MAEENELTNRNAAWSPFETLALAQPAEKVLSVRLNRPQRLNALNTRMAQDLTDLFERELPLRRDIGVVVLTGSGDKAFCVGADLKERHGMDDVTWRHQHELFRRAFDAMGRYQFPLIAAVNGFALGGGAEMALVADFIYAAAGARFGFPEVRLGIMPGVGGTQRLPRVVGEPLAKELLLSGRQFTAEEALAWGMVNRILPAAEVLSTAIETAATIAANAPLSVQGVKRSVRHGMQGGFEAGMQLEVSIHQRLSVSADRVEGIAAFNEKRLPEWRGD